MNFPPASEPVASNPFATRFIKPAARPYRFANGVSLAPLIDRILANQASLILGPHGSGKSTLLHDVVSHANRRGAQTSEILLNAPSDGSLIGRFSHWRKCRRCVGNLLADMRSGTLFAIDGFEQLSPSDRRRVRKRAERTGVLLLVTSHKRVPGFQIVHHAEVTQDVILQLANELLASASPTVDAAVRRQLESVSLESVQNVRDLWFDLYDVAEEASAVQHRPAR